MPGGAMLEASASVHRAGALMNPQETKSILTIALMAAFADGMKDDDERAAVKRMAESLGADAGVDLPALYREVLIAKPDLAQVATGLPSPELRQLAYELAVGVCEADGTRGPAEVEFLARLAGALGLGAGATGSVHTAADELRGAAAAATAAETAVPATGTVLGKASVPDAEMDKTILNASIMNAALELLPESIASMAIIPLQMRLVHKIGKAYGYPMDMSHAKDFIATLGVGLTGQYLEQFGRKLLGGLLGGIGGGIGRGVGRQAASSAMTFATTYAIGRVAQRYYAGGRTIDGATLKQTFLSMVDEAKGLAPRYQGQIEQMSTKIDTRSLASLIKTG
jgi:uncharacterized protein (DUF697 family)/tellurite resistance protein